MGRHKGILHKRIDVTLSLESIAILKSEKNRSKFIDNLIRGTRI
jgi:hypothetical protein